MLRGRILVLLLAGLGGVRAHSASDDECVRTLFEEFDKIDNSTKFGHDMLQYFVLEEDYVNYNHGSFGSSPKIVMNCVKYWQSKAEAHPDRWFRYELKEKLMVIKRSLARYMGVEDADDLILVPNASAAISLILRSLKLISTDVIVYFSEAFGTVKMAIDYVTRKSGARAVEIPIWHPISDSDILDSLQTILDRYSGRVKLIVVSHVASSPVLWMPIEPMAEMARANSALFLVDGAHAFGSIRMIDADDFDDYPDPGPDPERGGFAVRRIDPDFYVANGHKWFFSARGSAVVYVKRSVRLTLDPQLLIESSYFHESQTIDYANILTFGAALAFRRKFGERRIVDYNKGLAAYAGARLAAAWNTSLLATTSAAEKTPKLPMVNVRLPADDSMLARAIMRRLARNNGVHVIYFTTQKHHYARISAQIYNERKDYDRLAELVLEILEQWRHRS